MGETKIDLGTYSDGKIIFLMIGIKVPKDLMMAARDEWNRRKNKEVRKLAEEASDGMGGNCLKNMRANERKERIVNE